MKRLKRVFRKFGRRYEQIIRTQKYIIYRETTYGKNNHNEGEKNKRVKYSPFVSFVLYQVQVKPAAEFKELNLKIAAYEYLPGNITVGKKIFVFRTLSDSLTKLNNLSKRKVVKKSIIKESDFGPKKYLKKYNALTAVFNKITANEIEAEYIGDKALETLEREFLEIAERKKRIKKFESGNFYFNRIKKVN